MTRVINQNSQQLNGNQFGSVIPFYAARPPYPPPIFEWIRSRVLANARILDAACGNGRATIDLYHQVTHDVTGVDFDPRMIQEAMKRSREQSIEIPYVVADLTNALNNPAFHENQFDAITVCSAIHWLLLPDKLESISSLHSLLKPMGKLLIVDGIMDKKSTTGPFGKYRDRIDDILHRTMKFQEVNSDEELQKHGFRFVEKRKFYEEAIFPKDKVYDLVRSTSKFAELSSEEQQYVWPILKEEIDRDEFPNNASTVQKTITHQCYLYERV